MLFTDTQLTNGGDFSVPQRVNEDIWIESVYMNIVVDGAVLISLVRSHMMSQ